MTESNINRSEMVELQNSAIERTCKFKGCPTRKKKSPQETAKIYASKDFYSCYYCSRGVDDFVNKKN